ncbi:hypothetical protein TNCV_233111 [Trichonephila clavipes]|nr:hypothetical protein TNCV_233111 [Trichonephila clavipes]
MYLTYSRPSPVPTRNMTTTREPNPVEEWNAEKIHFSGWHHCDRFFPYSGSERIKRHRELPLKVLVKAVSPKCLGGPPVDRDLLNAHLGLKASLDVKHQ